MRTPLDDITNTVTSTSQLEQQQQQHGSSSIKQPSSIPKSSSSVLSAPSYSSSSRSLTSSKPKLLRQTSLLAFTAARSVPSSSSSTTTCSSPIASTSSSSPPPLPPSSSTSLLHPPSDEGYSSTRDFDHNNLDCDTREDGHEDGEEDDAFSDTEHLYSSNNKRQKRHSTSSPSSYRHHHGIPAQVIRDPASIARQAKAMARNKANLFGDTSRATRFEDVARLSEYSRDVYSRNVLGRVLDRHPNDYLESFVSHYKRDVFRCPSYRGSRDHAPPFACSFSKESKRGGKKVLAVSSEEGTVCFWDAEKRGGTNCGDATYFQAHNNAVFDLVWSADDRQTATASGDQSAAVADVERQIRTHHLKTHCCSVKQIIFDPHNPNLLATASRDGAIGLWDLRSKPTKDGSLATVNHIRFAHDTYAKSRKGQSVARSVTRSVTSIVYMQHQDNLLASGGSADGVVKLWDLRKTFTKRINPPSIEESLDYTPVSSFDIEGPPPLSSSLSSFSSSPAANSHPSSSSFSVGTPSSSFAPSRTTRTHGISSLCLSPDGSRLYALSTNSKIYAHDALFLSRPLSSPMHTFSSPTMCSSTFYIRLAISPDGRYLAAGSSSLGWQTSIWDLQAHSARTVYGETKKATVALKGHGHEVGGIDWADGVLSTCGDDDLVRLWRPDPLQAGHVKRDPKGRERWQYSGIWDQPEQ